MLELLVVFWLAISLVAIVITAWDKHAARAGLRRIPEATLLWIGFFGGAAAMLAVMKVIRHKTRKPKFMIGLPLMLVLHILLVGGALLWQWRTLFLSM